MTDCIFCKIIAGEIPATIIYKTETTTVFKDLNPQAPTHLLVIPNHHFENIAELDDTQLIADLITTAQQTAKEQGLKDFRLVTNNGRQAGQTVFHLHVHLLGGWQGDPNTALDLA